MKPLNRKQRAHIEALSMRFVYVSQPRPERVSEPDYVPGEAQALAWAIAVLGGADTPPEVRIEMLERRMRSVESHVGRINKVLDEEFEEVDD